MPATRVLPEPSLTHVRTCNFYDATATRFSLWNDSQVQLIINQCFRPRKKIVLLADESPSFSMTHYKIFVFPQEIPTSLQLEPRSTMAVLGITVALLVWVVTLLMISVWKQIYSSWNLPPGPFPLPFFGNVLQVDLKDIPKSFNKVREILLQQGNKLEIRYHAYRSPSLSVAIQWQIIIIFALHLFYSPVHLGHVTLTVSSAMHDQMPHAAGIIICQLWYNRCTPAGISLCLRTDWKGNGNIEPTVIHQNNNICLLLILWTLHGLANTKMLLGMKLMLDVCVPGCLC